MFGQIGSGMYAHGVAGTNPLMVRVQTGIRGPEIPEPGREAPHQDAAELVDGFLGDLQGVGCKITRVLDKPLDATVHFKGPHHIANGLLNTASGIVRDRIEKDFVQG
jgi:hypothetical protein